jgi:LysM repeat protein
MDIYLTDLATNQTFQFPMLPTSIKCTAGAQFQNFSLINVGTIQVPSGEDLTGFSWSGKLPGAARQNEPYVSAWQDPKAIQSLWSTFRNQKKKLRLMVTETPINHNVYLDSYTVTYSGGFGDYDYSISFVQAKDLKVYVSGTTTNSTTQSATTTERPAPPPASTYTVAAGDSLWAIAQKKMGAGSKYTTLYTANQSTIDAEAKKRGGSKYAIYPGEVLTIPSS